MPTVDEIRVKASRVQGKIKRIRNLIPDFKGSQMIIDYQGFKRSAFIIAQVTSDFEKGLNGRHSRMIGLAAELAERNFRTSIERPAERGSNPGSPAQASKRRMTGRFTFGARGGGTFRGVLIIEKSANLYGFGYPNVRIADSKTRFVWRTLEFGIGGRGSGDPEGPRAPHMMPFPFYFRPTQNGALFPRGRAVAVFPGGKRPRGIEPKYFITRAMQEVGGKLRGEYEQLVSETYGSL